jgi:hypothetical protein
MGFRCISLNYQNARHFKYLLHFPASLRLIAHRTISEQMMPR